MSMMVIGYMICIMVKEYLYTKMVVNTLVSFVRTKSKDREYTLMLTTMFTKVNGTLIRDLVMESISVLKKKNYITVHIRMMVNGFMTIIKVKE
jgi:hypothetical protein